LENLKKKLEKIKKTQETAKVNNNIKNSGTNKRRRKRAKNKKTQASEPKIEFDLTSPLGSIYMKCSSNFRISQTRENNEFVEQESNETAKNSQQNDLISINEEQRFAKILY
jgi:hypothetical protein